MIGFNQLDEHKGDGSLKDFLTFRKMIATTAIQVIFWIMSGFWVIVGLYMMTQSSGGSRSSYGYSSSSGSGGTNFLVGLLIIAFGLLYSRIFCEFLIVIFRINDTLTDIRNEGKGARLGSSFPGPGGPNMMPATSAANPGSAQPGTFQFNSPPAPDPRPAPAPRVAPPNGAAPGAATTGRTSDARTCVTCGIPLTPGQKYCTNCGAVNA